MRIKYWLLREPHFDDYNRGFFVNGQTFHPIYVPFVTCPRCHEAFAWGRVLRFGCPTLVRKALKALKVLHRENGAVDWGDFLEFRKYAEPILREKGHEIQLQAGDRFQPLVWDVPSRPRQDFFWTRSLVVSRRAKALFEEHGIRGADFFRVRLGRVGEAESWNDFPSDDLTDPIDLFDRMPLLADPSVVGTFYDMDMRNVAPCVVPAGEEKCSFCGTVADDESLFQHQLNRDLSAYDADVDLYCWRQNEVVVSEKTVNLIREYRLTGADVVPFE